MANNQERFFKVGTDVFSTATGTPADVEKVDLPKFKQLGINIDLLKQGIAQAQPIEAVRDTETKAFLAEGGQIGQEETPFEIGGFNFELPDTLDATILNEAAETPTTREDTSKFLEAARQQIEAITKAQAELSTLGQPTEQETVLEEEALQLRQAQRADVFGVLERGAVLRGGAQREIANIESGLTASSRTRLLKSLEVTERLNLLQGRRLGELEAKRIALGTTERNFDRMITLSDRFAKENRLNFITSDIIVNPDTNNQELIGIDDKGKKHIIDLGIKGKEDEPQWELREVDGSLFRVDKKTGNKEKLIQSEGRTGDKVIWSDDKIRASVRTFQSATNPVTGAPYTYQEIIDQITLDDSLINKDRAKFIASEMFGVIEEGSTFESFQGETKNEKLLGFSEKDKEFFRARGLTLPGETEVAPALPDTVSNLTN